MNKITACMSVCGDARYFKYAEYSIPSFCRSNPNTRLLVFTDKVQEMADKYYRDFTNCLFFNFADICAGLADHLAPIADKTRPTMVDFRNHDRVHHHNFVSFMLPMAQVLADTDYVLKIDCDTYFRGPLIAESEAFIKDNPDIDLFLVERRDPVMVLFQGNLPGVGYTLWKRQSKFIENYINYFYQDEQQTIIYNVKNLVPSYEIPKPGFHLVYPFSKAERSGRAFTKKVCDEYYPLYLHCGGPDVEGQLETLKGWYE